MALLRRHLLEPEIAGYLRNPDKILVVEGVRQTGKTTAIKQALQGRPQTLITLSDEDLAAIQVREAKTFEELTLQLKRHFRFEPDGSSVLVLDEAQRSPHLYGLIMQMAEQWQQGRKVPIILSGSVMGAFFKRHRDKKIVSPAGRIARTICRPFSFYEFLEWTGQGALLEEIRSFDFRPFPEAVHERALFHYFEYLTTGGYPEAIARREGTEDLYSYFQTLLSFFWQDADRYLSEVMGENRHQYGRLMQAVFEAIARHTGDTTKRSSLVSTDSPAYRTILPSLLDAAEDWHFLFRLPTEMKTFSAKPGFSSKKYLWDVGMVNHILHLSRPVRSDSDPALVSKLIESSVAQELIFYLKVRERLSSWKSQQKQSRELDFLAHFPDFDAAFEVKASRRIQQKAISQLIEYIKVHPRGRFYVVYLGPYHRVLWNGTPIHWIPPYLVGCLPSEGGATESTV